MNTIPQTYTKNTWDYRLIERTAQGAIYSQSRKGGRVTDWEVVRIRTRKGRTITTPTGSYEIKAGEYLPTTEEWGTHGWTFTSLAGARDRLNAISQTPHQKPAGVPGVEISSREEP